MPIVDFKPQSRLVAPVGVRVALWLIASVLIALGVAGAMLWSAATFGFAIVTINAPIDAAVLTYLWVASLIGAGSFIALLFARGDQSGIGTDTKMALPGYGHVLGSDACRGLARRLETACMKVLDEDCTVLALNRACLDFMEADSAEPFLGMCALDALRPSDRIRFKEAIDKAVAGGISEVEYELTGANGTRRWLLQRAVRLDASNGKGGKATVLCLTREVTQSKLTKDRLDMAIEITRQGLWDEWIQTGEVHYNENWFTMLGYEPGELSESTETWHKLVHPDDLHIAQAEFKKHIRRETPTYKAEYRMRAKDGSWRWIQDIGRITEWAENGVALRAIGVHIDIDQSKRLEQALRSIVSYKLINSSESMLQHMCRVLTEALDVDIVCISRLDDHSASRAKVIAGWSPDGPVKELEYILTDTPCEVVKENDYCHICDNVQQQFPADQFLNEVNAKSYTGLILRDSGGVPIGLLIIMDSSGRSDSPESESMLKLFGARAAAELERLQIETELHRTRERLLSYADRLETATTGAGLGVFEYRYETSELIWDDTMHELYGTTDAEITPSMEVWESKLHPEDLERMQRLLKQVEGGLDHIDAKFRILPDGETIRHISVASTVSRRPDGSPIAMTGVNWDITDIAIASEQLTRAKELAESISSAKSEFLANMSHEIRTPLTAIIGYTDLLVNDEDFTRDPDRLTRSLTSIQNNAEHLLVILNDILDLTKIDAGMMQLESVELCPVELIRGAVAMLSARAVAKGIDLNVNFLTKLPTTITSDPTRIRQVLLNLIGNAVKFTEEGSVTTDVSYQSLPDCTGRLVIAVRDTGIGIAEKDVTILRNFDPFTQADGSMTRRFGGTGLGLRLTNAFAKRLGGNLAIESEIGMGSTFTVTIRVTPNADGSMQQPKALCPHTSSLAGGAQSFKKHGLAGKHILLVEDGPDNQRLLSYMLTKAGATVSIACNGREAVEIVQQVKAGDTAYDLILMDMQMPEIDGYSATAMLRELDYIGPIVALTAHAMEGDRQRCLNAGCQDYLTKPVSSHMLVESCQKWIGWKWTGSAAA